MQPRSSGAIAAPEAVDSPREKPAFEPEVSGDFEKRDLVTIRKFRDLPEALLAKGSLESAGIEAFLADDNMVRMDRFISNLLGGIKLVVDAENADAANKILNQPIPENFDFEGGADFQQPRCPMCQSMDFSFEELDRLAYGIFLVALPIPIHRKDWICHSCKHEWLEDETGRTRNLPSRLLQSDLDYSRRVFRQRQFPGLLEREPVSIGGITGGA